MEHALPPEHPIAAVGSFVVVSHEASSRSYLVDEWSKRLQAAQPDRAVRNVWLRGRDIDTCHEQVIGALSREHEQGISEPLLVSAGGDGGLHFNGNNLLHPDTPSKIAKTVMTCWELGRANDWYAQMHDPATRNSPTALFEHPGGRICESSPLDVRVVYNGAARTDRAFLYATFGLSVDALCTLDSQAHRQWRARFPAWLHDCIDIVATAPTMLTRQHSAWAASQGTLHGRRITEAEFVNGARMAERANFSRYTTLDDNTMFYAELNRRNPLAIAAFAARLVLGRPPGYRTTRGVTLNFLKGSLHGQIDGVPLLALDGKPANIQAAHIAPGQQSIRYYATQ